MIYRKKDYIAVNNMNRKPDLLLSAIFTYWLTTPLKRIWICKLLLFQQTLNKQKICFACFIHKLFFFLTLVNFSFANPDFFFKSFNLDISLPLLDYTASFVTQKKKIPTLSPKLPFQLFICKKKKLILILSSIYFLILC